LLVEVKGAALLPPVICWWMKDGMGQWVISLVRIGAFSAWACHGSATGRTSWL